MQLFTTLSFSLLNIFKLIKNMVETTKIYNSDSITVLEGLEAIRYRPDMYIGSPSGNPSDGLYRLCREIIDNSVDEYLANCNDSIYILYDSKTMITTVIDNGRGIPVGWNEKAKMDSLTAVVTKIHAGGKFNHETYKTSSGKNGVGASAVNALSDMMQVWSNNSVDRKWYTQKFERGIAKNEVEKVKLPEEYKAYIKKTGTIITWLPDKTIFTDSIKLNLSRLKRELHDIQFLCPKLRIKLIIDGNEAEYYSEKGLSELVSRSSSDGMFTFTNEWMDVAVNFTKDDGYEFKSYVNVCYTNLGGTHLDGLKKALCNTLKSYSKNKILNEDLMEGVVGAIHCKVAEPQYQGQTKNELTNSEVEGLVVDALNEPLNKFFKKNKALTERIIKYAEEMLEKKQKMKADKALLKGISQLNAGAKFISDKFLDADRRKYKNPKDLELFIVEGDSAGGHFNKAREPYQASLRIRGKIINAAKADPADLFGSKTEKNEGNKEIKSIVAALGCGIQDDYDESKLRFNKIIIMSDADTDGEHIANLLMSFFIQYMPKLVQNGHLYTIDAPLFIGNSSKGKKFGMTRVDVDNQMKAENIKDYDILRLKGWGECTPEQLSELCLDKKTRKLKQIKWTDNTEDMLEKTMGNGSTYRKQLLGVID